MAALRPIPNLTISSPMDEHELRRLMFTAQLPGKGAFVIRYPRGCGVKTDWRCPLEEVAVGRGRRLKAGKDIAVLSIGPCGNDVAKAIAEIEKEHPGIAVAHYDMRFLKPLDEDILREAGGNFGRIVTVEDGARNGGLGSAVTEWMNDNGYSPRITRIGLPDRFVEHGTVEELKDITGTGKDGIKRVLAQMLCVAGNGTDIK